MLNTFNVISNIYDKHKPNHWKNYKETYSENILFFKNQNYFENISCFFSLNKQMMFFFEKEVGKNRIWFS